MKNKIKIRFMLISAAAIIVTAAVSMFLFYQILIDQIFSDLEGYTRLIEKMDIHETISAVDQADTGNTIRVTLVGEDGTVIFDNVADASTMENHNNRPEIAGARKNDTGRAIRYSKTISEHTLYFATHLENDTVIRVSKTTGSIICVFRNTILLIIGISCVTFLISMFFAHLLTKKMIEPIEKMAENILIIDTEKVYDEIRPFVNTIKEQHMNILMHGKIRQEFTANVSHELKTPLTSISGYAELIENGMVNEEDTRRFAGQIQKNASRLLSLINDIIKLSELDDPDMEVVFEPVDIYKVAENCLSMLEFNADKMEVSLHMDGECALINGNKGLLEELLYNLCTNGIRYNKRGGSVRVTVEKRNQQVIVSVEDTGIGIPLDHQERVFERFYRVDKSRSKLTGGTGLGLAIVKHIVAQHEGTIKLESVLSKGTKIMVTFKSYD